MEQKKSLTQNGISATNFLFIINSAVMIGVSIYLTTHFYDTLYPTKLGGASSLCDISNFFNCDTATYSVISNIAGVPISFFGMIVGLFFLISSLMPSSAMEKSASALAKLNFIGCLALFTYSLVVLHSLCPFCSLYYVLSGIACFLLWKFGENSWMPDLKVTGIWVGIVLVGSFFMYQTTQTKEETKNRLNASVVEQYRKLPSLGEPDVESPYKIHMSTQNWNDAPIRISVFSDFECPFCKVVSEQMPELIRRYGSKINIQYFFYPLDAKCNSNVTRRMHENACDAAMLAACDEKKFAELHDEIFANQEKLGSVLPELAKKHNLNGCFDNQELKNKVITAINQGAKFNLKSTPTIILNGKKIEGTIPSNQFFAIFEDILHGPK
ncbi:MAG: thioredoxin domain-containing protein [Bacteriovoracaceae bacterium]